MGFKLGRNAHTIKSVHSFRNDPDKTHQTCTRCGCRKVQTYSNQEGKAHFTYYDKYSNVLPSIPTECKGLYDLLNEE